MYSIWTEMTRYMYTYSLFPRPPQAFTLWLQTSYSTLCIVATVIVVLPPCVTFTLVPFASPVLYAGNTRKQPWDGPALWTVCTIAAATKREICSNLFGWMEVHGIVTQQLVHTILTYMRNNRLSERKLLEFEAFDSVKMFQVKVNMDTQNGSVIESVAPERYMYTVLPLAWKLLHLPTTTVDHDYSYMQLHCVYQD